MPFGNSRRAESPSNQYSIPKPTKAAVQALWSNATGAAAKIRTSLLRTCYEEFGFHCDLSIKYMPQVSARRQNQTKGISLIQIFGKNSAEREIRDGLPGLFPRLWRYGLILASNKDDAMDLAQMTCVRALEKPDGYTPGTRLDSWLFKIEQRLWLNELRSRAVRRGGGLMPVEDLDLADDAPDSESNIFLREVLSTIYALPEAQRTTVLLVYVEGFKYAEAAEILDIPVGTVMSRLAAARGSINARLADQNEGIA